MYFKKILNIHLVLFLLFSPFFYVSASATTEPHYKDYQHEQFFGVGYFPDRWTYSGKGITVAVIDQGVWESHYDLGKNIWLNYGEDPSNGLDDDGNGYVDDFYGWNFVADSPDVSVYGTHGTAVASIIASVQNEWGMSGIAHNAEIMNLLACNSIGCSVDDVVDAIYYAVNNGANIINLSLGTNGYVAYKETYSKAIQYAYDNGVLVVASSGNGDVESANIQGQNLNFMPVSPVCNDNDEYNTVLGVGTSDTFWDNYGRCVDLTAPGRDVFVATVPLFSEGYYFTWKSGTSFSAPFVSGAAALLMEKYPDWELFEIMNHMIQTSRLGVIDIKKMMDNTPAVPTFVGTLPLSVKAGTEIAVEGKNFNTRRKMFLNYESGNKVEVKRSEKTFVDANKMMVRIPSTVEAGRYSFSFEHGWKNSSFFNVKNSSVVSGAKETGADEVLSDKGEVDVNLAVYEPLKHDSSLIKRLTGYILIQSQEQGQAWYVNPADSKRYYMKNGSVAYSMMRSFGLGITDPDLEKIPFVNSEEEMSKKTSVCSSNKTANSVKGKILLQVQQHGEAWYVHPDKCYRIYMKDGDVAYKIMRFLSLGIAKQDLTKMPTGELVK